jgi:gluconate 2-dehydrogenase gamma chain
MIDKKSLTAVMDRLIPADPDWPSASKNDVLDYFDHQMNSDLAGYSAWVAVGFYSLDIESKVRFDGLFQELNPNEQDQILTDIEAGNVQTPWAVSPQEWFNRLNEWVAEGYYADPEHNHGNPNKISWQMVGFDECK